MAGVVEILRILDEIGNQVAVHAVVCGGQILGHAVAHGKAVIGIAARLEEAKNARRAALERLGLSDKDFVPKYICPKCSDTGFLPNGKMCDCYREG